MKAILIIQNHEIETPGTIADYLVERQMNFETVHAWRGEQIPSGENYHASIVMGCPLSVSDTPNHDHLKHLYMFTAETVRFNRPYLGICFGSQILAKALGATVEKNPGGKEVGTSPVRLTPEGQADPLFAGFPAEFMAFHWHGETFRIPFGAKNLATSDICTNQGFRIGTAVGIQFHFEASAEKLPVWCDVYSADLAELGTDTRTISESFRSRADEIRQLNYRLLDNFFALI